MRDLPQTDKAAYGLKQWPNHLQDPDWTDV